MVDLEHDVVENSSGAQRVSPSDPVNLLLLEHDELDAEGVVELTDERAAHLRKVLRVQAGDAVRVGIVDGPVGSGEVLRISRETAVLRCRCDESAPAPGTDTLLLAFPRPKVLLRCLEHATALGFGNIVLFRSRRVEKSHLHSHSVTAEAIQLHLRRGLSQSRRTQRPTVARFERFRELVGAYERLGPPNGFVAHPSGTQEACLSQPKHEPLQLVIGPEGGLVDYEVQQLVAIGFQPVRAGYQPLRVESAVSYLAGQLHAARALSAAYA